MTSILVFDTESDGFLNEATKIWCLVGVDYSKPLAYKFTPDQIQQSLALMSEYDVLVCHNIKKHDLPLIKKLYGWEPASHQIIIDTLILSRLLNPKRPLPIGYKGKATHSIEAWGYRLGLEKPEHEDWTQFSSEMLHRCHQDACINRLILKELEREAGDTELFYHKAKPERCDKAGA